MSSARYPLFVLASVLLALAIGRSWPVSAALLLALGAYSIGARGAWTPQGRFGYANALTWLRIFGCAILLALSGGLAPVVLAFTIFVLDGVDGGIARRLGTASKFGADLDKECDAFYVLVLSMLLYWQGGAGAWVLIPGLWRYVYGVGVAFWPSSRVAPRSQWARYTYSTCSLSMMAALVPDNPFASTLALFATVAMSASFIRSSYYSFSRN